MKIISGRWIFSAFLFWLFVESSLAVAAPQVQLLVRTPLTAPHVNFDANTQEWLDTKPSIRVAFWGDSRPPLHMGLDPNSFEGVTADVLGLLQKILGVEIQMVRFSGRTDAQQAMALGEVDVLALNDVTEPDNKIFEPSLAYLLNHKVTILRSSDSISSSDDLTGARIGYIATNESHLKRIRDQYPDSKLVRYVNHLNALAGVAYNQIDAFRTDAITAEFLLLSLNRNDLYVAENKKNRQANINFAVSSQYPLLLKAINQALAKIPVADMLRITSNWGLSNNVIIARKPLALTSEQRRWIAEHPKLKVVVADAYAPLTFFDAKNHLSGLGYDMLKLIEHKTGLEFDVVRSTSISDTINMLQNRKVDFAAALVISDFLLERNQYTRPYLITPCVVVTKRDQANVQSLAELSGSRLAINWGSKLSKIIKTEFPDIVQVEVKNTTVGLEVLAAGKVDGAIHTLYGAEYFINHHFQNDLHIAAVTGGGAARIAMAVGPDNQILKGIINAVLLSIRPDEFRAMTDRWGGDDVPSLASPWKTYQNVVCAVIAVSTLIGLVFLIWNYYLRINIQKRQRAERDLEDQLQFTSTLINGAPVALYVWSADGYLVQCNQEYLNFLNTSRDAVINKSLKENVEFWSAISLREQNIYLEAIHEGKALFNDIDVEVHGKKYRVYRWVLPFHNSAGQYKGVIGGWLDITERENLIEQLRLAKQAAISANQSKSDFLASMSHEIRTPVSALVGLIELLRLKGVGADQVDESLEVAHQSAQSLLSLIGEILDLSKIEAGEMTPKPQATNLCDMARSIHRLFEPNARKKNLDFRLIMEVQNHGIIIDSLMLNQIVANLLSNAIKFTDHGSVQLLIRELPSEAVPGRARFAIQISDTGMGISQAHQQEIFEPFVQADPHAHRAVGTGLGLSICASMTKLLNAELSVDSQIGLGSRFTLMFEADLVDLVENPAFLPSQPASSHKLRVLVVEDHGPNRLLLCRQLEYLGHAAFPCEDGEAALKQWMHAEPPFDLTITDCNMPRIDGYELTQSMRYVEQQKAVSMHPIFGLTASAQEEIIERCRQAGMTRCLFKPLSIETIASLIAEVQQNSKRRTLAAANTGSELEKIRLLSPESYGSLVNELMVSHRKEGMELERLVRLDDRAGLARVAHKIRGGAQLAGDSALIDACRVLEQFANEGESSQYGTHVEGVLTCLRSLEDRLVQDLTKSTL